MLLLVAAVDHLPAPHHQEAGVPDVGGVQLEIGVGEHHQTGRAGPDYLLLVLLHFTETLQQPILVTVTTANSGRHSEILPRRKNVKIFGAPGSAFVSVAQEFSAASPTLTTMHSEQ